MRSSGSGAFGGRGRSRNGRRARATERQFNLESRDSTGEFSECGRRNAESGMRKAEWGMRKKEAEVGMGGTGKAECGARSGEW